MPLEQTMRRVRGCRTTGVWPSRQDLDVEGWMGNFEAAAQPLAEALIAKFTYYSDLMAREVLRRAIRQAVAAVANGAADRRAVLQSAMFTCPPGEDGGPTASGYAYLRMLREIGVDGSQAFHPDEAIFHKAAQPDRLLVVVDDFSCTGAQFDHYWRGVYKHGGTDHRPVTLTGPIVFSPLFTTWMAHGKLARFGNVLFKPVHQVTSILTSPDIQPHRRLLREISIRLGAVDSNGADPLDWKGFGALSHAIAVGGTIPDSALPIFYLEDANWVPLKRRRQ